MMSEFASTLTKLSIYPAGIEGFSNVNRTHIEAALPVLKRNGVPYLIHAEIVDEDTEPQVRLVSVTKDMTDCLRLYIHSFN